MPITLVVGGLVKTAILGICGPPSRTTAPFGWSVKRRQVRQWPIWDALHHVRAWRGGGYGFATRDDVEIDLGVVPDCGRHIETASTYNRRFEAPGVRSGRAY